MNSPLNMGTTKITHSATTPTTKSDVTCRHSHVHHQALTRHTFHSVVVNVDAILHPASSL